MLDLGYRKVSLEERNFAAKSEYGGLSRHRVQKKKDEVKRGFDYGS